MRILSSILVSAAALLLAAPLAAQLRGTVHDRTSGSLLAGAVIVAQDSSGKTAGGSTITDLTGRFAITLAPAARRIHVIRIGFRPVDLPIPAKREGSIDILMDHVPPMLDAVRVKGDEICPGSADRGAAFQLWEQVRDGLVATVIARDAKPADARTLMYESILAGGNEEVQRQTRKMQVGRTVRPFRASISPAEFARGGYVSDGPSGRLFYGPDADVLTDPSFIETHCINIQNADRDHPGQVGLSFEPAPGRGRIVDVKGTIWVDAGTPQLRSVDFRYTSLESVLMKWGAGGHIEFRSMPNGVAFIERWMLRVPNTEIDNRAQSLIAHLSGADIAAARANVRIVSITEAGGIVLDGAWDDGTRWQSPATRIGGTVDRKDGQPASGAAVTLIGTGDTTRTSAGGAFDLPDVVPGRYRIAAIDTALDVFAEPRADTKDVVVPRDSTQTVHFELPSLAPVIEDACRGQKVPPGTALLVGNLRMESGRVPDGARVVAHWEATPTATNRPLSLEHLNDSEGRFTLCGAPPGSTITLSFIYRGQSLAQTTVTLDPHLFTNGLNWVVRQH